MRPAIALLLAALLAPAFAARAAEYNRVLAGQSRISFVSKQMGVPVEGQFRGFSVRLAFDPARPAAGRAAVDIQLASVDAGSQDADDELKRPNWFDVKHFPVAHFESTALRSLGGDRYEVSGPMTLKGRTREVVAPFTFTPSGRDALIQGGFTLKRLEWGIGGGEWSDTDTVADEVQVKFRFLATQAPAEPPDRKQ
jgi:polyisoprenoid-binding protein YceI